MPDHEVIMRIVPPLKIGNSDIGFDIRFGKEKLGSLGVSRGHITWTPVNNEYGYWLPWRDFGSLAVEKGRRRKVKY